MSTLRSPQVAELARTLHVRPAVGMAAHVIQGEGLEIVRIRVDRPALIRVDRGIKTVKPERGAEARARPGQALLLAAGQTVDFHNRITDGERYEARWLMFGGTVLADPYYLAAAQRIAPADAAVPPARALRHVPAGLEEAFERARGGLAPDPSRPDAVVRQQLLEVAHWLLAEGLVLRVPADDARVSGRIRADPVAGHVVARLRHRPGGRLRLAVTLRGALPRALRLCAHGRARSCQRHVIAETSTPPITPGQAPSRRTVPDPLDCIIGSRPTE